MYQLFGLCGRSSLLIVPDFGLYKFINYLLTYRGCTCLPIALLSYRLKLIRFVFYTVYRVFQKNGTPVLILQ